MTTPRDPDALLVAYLADGMEVLPDRVVDAVLDEVHRTRQRAVFDPWRTRSMFKIALGAAAVLAVLVLGGSFFLFQRGQPAIVVGGPSSSVVPARAASWTATGTMVRRTHYSHTATLLSDGKVLVAGATVVVAAARGRSTPSCTTRRPGPGPPPARCSSKAPAVRPRCCSTAGSC